MTNRMVVGTLLSVALVLAFAASAQGQYSDAMNINICQSSTVGLVSAPIDAGQAPPNLGAGYWNNVRFSDDYRAPTSAGGGYWVGDVKTEDGTAVPTTGGSAFVLHGYVSGTIGGWSAAGWNSSIAGLHNGMYRLNSNDEGGAGYPGTKTWIAAENVPFTSYDVYAYQLKLSTDTYNGGDADWEWVKLNTTEITSSSFALEWDKKSGQRCLAALQILKAGGAAATDMTASPEPGALVFGNPAVNGGNVAINASAQKTVTLTALNGNVTVAPAVSGSFSFVGTPPTQPVAPGTPAVYTLQLDPQAVPGHYIGTATFTTDISLGGGLFKTFTYALSADVAAHPGDVNCDGEVSGSDFNVIKANFGLAGLGTTGWTLGDVNGDGEVSGSDFNVVKVHFGHTTADGVGAGAVPEPATLALLALAIRPKR